MARKSRKNQEMTFKIYKTAIYARLSREQQSLEKIQMQVDEVKEYLKNRQIFELVDVYMDNGYSGTNFQRPEFERLMEDLRNGKIDCIVVKDLSRFAREHIGAEDYLNNIFPFLGVRFIAINDGYDNLNIEPQEYFLASFKSLANAHFALETSKKVKQAKKTLQEQGKFIGSRVSFGYKKDLNDKHKLVIDEEKATIVREIFEKIANDERTKDVASYLNEKYKQNGYVWKVERIDTLLKKEIYKGVLTQRQTVTDMYKMERMPKDEQIRIENAVPAIVTAELWQKANDVIKQRNMAKHDVPENPYKGLVFCGRCQKKIAGGFRRDVMDFTFNCSRCKSGIFAKGEQINQAVREHLKLSTEITAEFLAQHFEKIEIFGKKRIVLQDKGGGQN